jgi:hypothetical protein
VRTRLIVVGVAAVLAASGCTGGSPADREPAPADDRLDVSDCVVQDSAAAAWREVACDDPGALASVTKVEFGGAGVAGALAEPDCPAGTDHALRATDLPGVRFTFACARNLKPPHPGDPGEGGGPDIVVGDCVYSQSNLAKVEEVRCDGAGGSRPTHRVTLVTVAACPPPSALTIDVGARPFGNASPSAQRVACAEAL